MSYIYVILYGTRPILSSLGAVEERICGLALRMGGAPAVARRARAEAITIMPRLVSQGLNPSCGPSCPGCCATPKARLRASSTRYALAAWCAADPGPTAIGTAWIPALRCIVKDAAPRPGHRCFACTRKRNLATTPATKQHGGQITQSRSRPSWKNILIFRNGKSVHIPVRLTR